ncbi:MAG: signal peptidase II [Chloroflexota bacterium]
MSRSSAEAPDTTERRAVRWGQYGWLFGLAGLAIILDQVTKALVAAHLKGHPLKLLGGGLYVVYARNTGAAFSIFRSGGAVFVVIAVVVSAGIIVYFRRVTESPLPVRIALGLILGGALGNLIDRVRLGFVVDFIDLRWWPVFNIADSCIVIGTVLLIVVAFLQSENGGNRR